MSPISELVKKAIDEAVKGNTHCCFLLESPAKASDWIQITWDMLNMGYPFSEPPVRHLASMGITKLDGAALVGWEPAKFITFEHGSGNPELISRFIEDYAQKVFGVTDISAEMTIQEQDL